MRPLMIQRLLMSNMMNVQCSAPGSSWYGAWIALSLATERKGQIRLTVNP